MCENLELAHQWVAKAENDLLNADNNLNAEVEDANEAREAAEQVMEWLGTTLPELFQDVSRKQSEDQEIQNHEREH